MLTLREPMRLQSISGLKTYSDILGEKIAANYRLIGTEITGADLLHMTVQEPEQFLNMEYRGMLTVGNHIHADNQIKMELVNQLVNRLMFYLTPKFTYQDEVFVTSVLQKIGIADVNEFVWQVHRHMDRNVLLNEMINQYFAHGSDISDVVEDDRGRYRAMYHTELQKAYEKERQVVLYLHNSIFERLRTAECDNIIYTYNCQTDRGRTAVQGTREAAWTEQADAIQLSRLREILFHQTNPAVWRNDLYYEIKPFGQAELTEEKVVQRMAAAVLENVVQKIHCAWLQCRDRNGLEWRDYTRIFYQSAKDVIERFWYFQSEKNVDVRQRQIYANCMAELVQDERMLVQLLEEKSDFSGSRADIVLSVWENQNLQKQLEGRMQLEERLSSHMHVQGIDLEDGTEYREALRAFREIDQIFRQEQIMWQSGAQQVALGDQSVVQRRAMQESGKEQNSTDGQEAQGQEEEQAADMLRLWQMREGIGMSQKQGEEQAADMSGLWQVREGIDVSQEPGEEPIFREILQLLESDKRIDVSQEPGEESIPREVSQLLESGKSFPMLQKLGEEPVFREVSQLRGLDGQFRVSREREEEPVFRNISQLYGLDEQFQASQEQVRNILQQQDILNAQETQVQRDDFETVHRQDSQGYPSAPYKYMNEFLMQYEEFISDENVPFAENARLLEQINRHNLYMKQLLDGETDASFGRDGDTSKRIVVDQAKARQSALRAMENPQEVLREIYENASAIERKTPREIERILRVTDEQTRQFYRRLLGYDKEPETTAWDKGDNTSVGSGMETLERYQSGDSENVSFYADNHKRDVRNYDSSVIKDTLANYDSDRVTVAKSDTVKGSTGGRYIVGNSADKYSSNVADIVENNAVMYGADETEYIERNTVKYHDNETKHVESDAVEYSENGANYSKRNAVRHSENKINYSERNAAKHSEKETAHVENSTIRYITDETSHSENDVVKHSNDKMNHIKNNTVKNSTVEMNHTEGNVANYNTDEMKARVYLENGDIQTETTIDTVLKRIRQSADRIYREHIDFATIEPVKSKESIQTNGFFEHKKVVKYKDPVQIQMPTENPQFYGIDFVHKPKRQSADFTESQESVLSARIQDEIQSDIRTKLQSELEQIKQEQVRQERSTQQQLQDIKRSLAAGGEERLIHTVNRSLRTQVHEISDIVYRELERRLKNEQRRRGY